MIAVEVATTLVADRLAFVSNEVKLPFEDLADTCCTEEPKLLIDERVEELSLDALGS